VAQRFLAVLLSSPGLVAQALLPVLLGFFSPHSPRPAYIPTRASMPLLLHSFTLPLFYLLLLCGSELSFLLFFLLQQKTGESPRLRRSHTFPIPLSTRFRHVRRLGSFRSLHDLELHRISFLQCPVSLADDRRIMYEHIGAVVPPDESIPFRIVKPFNCSLHLVAPLAGDSDVSYSWRGSSTTRRHEHELRGVYQINFRSQANNSRKYSPLCIFMQ